MGAARGTNRVHGESGWFGSTTEYRIWCSMIHRCENPKNKRFSRYGGRGISVCEAWRESYQTFLRDVGRRPTDEHTLDRIDNDGNYEPGNVRWATRLEQQNNRSDVRRMTLGGETLPLEAWAARLGVSSSTLWSRIYRGWSDEKTLTHPLRGSTTPLTSRDEARAELAKRGER